MRSGKQIKVPRMKQILLERIKFTVGLVVGESW